MDFPGRSFKSTVDLCARVRATIQRMRGRIAGSATRSSAMTTAINVPDVLLKPKDAAAFLKFSLSWLAKARMRGDGPPYIRIGRSIRYSEAAVVQWKKSRR